LTSLVISPMIRHQQRNHTMIDLKTAMEIANYKVTGGSDYLWKCFGPNARYMDFDTSNDDSSFTVIFDSVTQLVYEVSVCDYTKNNCYRIIHPEYIETYKYEAISRNHNWKQAFDDVNYIDLEMDEDFITKAKAILNSYEYDERVEIAIDLPNELWFKLMKIAHERDITLNKLVEEIISDYISETDFYSEIDKNEDLF
jgi:hypothetical protein